MSQQQKFGSPYRRNISDERVLGLNTRNAQNKNASWNIRIAGNKARFTVWTNIDNDIENGKIESVVDWQTLAGFAEALRKVAASGETGPASTLIMRTLRLGKDGWKGGKIPAGDLCVGRDDEGKIWLAMIKKDRPKLRFFLEDDQWYNLYHHSGEQLSAMEASSMIANAYANAIDNLCASLFVQEYVEREEKKKDRDSNGRGYGSNRQSQQNTQQHSEPSTDFDDLDF